MAEADGKNVIPDTILQTLSVQWSPDFDELKSVLLGKITPAADDPQPRGPDSNGHSTG